MGGISCHTMATMQPPPGFMVSPEALNAEEDYHLPVIPVDVNAKHVQKRVDYSDENNVLQHVRPSRWLSMDIGGIRLFRCNWLVFFGASIFLWAFVIGVLASDKADSNPALDEFGTWMTWIARNFTWLYIGTQNVWMAFVVYMGLSRFGKLKLGKDNEACFRQHDVVLHAFLLRHWHRTLHVRCCRAHLLLSRLRQQALQDSMAKRRPVRAAGPVCHPLPLGLSRVGLLHPRGSHSRIRRPPLGHAHDSSQRVLSPSWWCCQRAPGRLHRFCVDCVHHLRCLYLAWHGCRYHLHWSQAFGLWAWRDLRKLHPERPQLGSFQAVEGGHHLRHHLHCDLLCRERHQKRHQEAFAADLRPRQCSPVLAGLPRQYLVPSELLRPIPGPLRQLLYPGRLPVRYLLTAGPRKRRLESLGSEHHGQRYQGRKSGFYGEDCDWQRHVRSRQRRLWLPRLLVH